VDKNTPSAFIWHCYDDDVVGVDHALVFGQALRKHAVPHEMHLYPKGGHGIGLAKHLPSAATWPKLCRLWLQGMGWSGSPAHVRSVVNAGGPVNSVYG
jgi:acetyl esterase/lipase